MLTVKSRRSSVRLHAQSNLGPVRGSLTKIHRGETENRLIGELRDAGVTRPTFCGLVVMTQRTHSSSCVEQGTPERGHARRAQQHSIPSP
jgi:hypothetical protein